MNRRDFISFALAVAAVEAIYDPEKRFWVPGKKTISIPKPRPKKYVATILLSNAGWFDPISQKVITMPGPSIITPIGAKLYAGDLVSELMLEKRGAITEFKLKKIETGSIPQRVIGVCLDCKEVDD